MTERDGLRIEARWSPLPASISPQARQNLARLVDADGRPRRLSASPMPAAHDAAGWEAARRESTAQMMLFLGQAAAHLRSKMETVRLGGVLVHVATPDGDTGERVYLDIHGGGLIHGGGEPCQVIARMNADRYGVKCCGVDYRMPPEHPYPAPLDDCLAVYRALLGQYAPQDIIVGGASAGGNLAAALALRARDEGLPSPAALVLLTPELDLTESGDSFETNRGFDLVLPGSTMAANRLYAGGHDLADPYLSPLFGDFTKGFPPTFLQCGTRDLFLSNTVRMHRALRRAKVPVELHVFEAMPHGGFMGAPEDAEVNEEKARFVSEHWGARR